MPNKLQIIICEKFQHEVSTIIEREKFDDVVMDSFHSNCHLPRIDTSPLLKTLDNGTNGHGRICILCTQYIKDLDNNQASCDDSNTIKIDLCFEMLCNKNLVDQYLKEGGYLLTPGWLRRWRQYIEEWGFDRETASRYFSECCRKLILLDTEIYEKSAVDLKEFADYIKLPYEIVSVGLDYFQLFITNIILKWRGESERKEANAELLNIQKKNADYNMIFDMIGRLAGLSEEPSVIKNTFNTFNMLFAPEKQVYIALNDDKPEITYSMPEEDIDKEKLTDLCKDFNGEYAWTSTGKGFLLKVRQKNKLLGIIHVEGISFPDYRESYLSYALSIATISGLAVSNARAYQKVIEAGESLKTANEELHIELVGHKRTKEELKVSNETLELRVIERTKELLRANEELEIEISERQKAEELIKASLREKETLLKEVHHRVKNNMQVISGLLKVQSERIMDKQSLHIFNESRDRIKSMSLVHESLYHDKDLSKIDFEKYTHKMIYRLMRSSGVGIDRITATINIDNVFLGIDAAIPCGLIINELFTNSLKYAFPYREVDTEHRPGENVDRERRKNKEEVRIDFHSNCDKYTLVFGDNGVGLPEDFDFQNPQTLGLDLVKGLVRQLGGTIKLNRNAWTEFMITFKV